MTSYEVRRHIAADAREIWATLTDPERLVAAGTGIARIEGRIEPGARFTLWSEAVPGRGFRTRVAAMDPYRRMVWEGGLPAGLFRGVRTFTLTPQADGGTEVHVREEFTGPLLRLVWRTMPDLQPSFDQLVDGLARSTEGAR
jgi:hypothetical protein